VTLALTGCLRRVEPPPPPAAPEAGTPAVEPAGTVTEGAWNDVLGLSMTLPPGWTARPGGRHDALRLVVRGPSGVRLDVWAIPNSDTPRPRAGCAWDWQDAGLYRSLPAPQGTRVARCVPTTPSGAHVLGWYARAGSLGWHVELVCPPGTLGPALDATRESLATLRLPLPGGDTAAPNAP
jgi:hypothetical protein